MNKPLNGWIIFGIGVVATIIGSVISYGNESFIGSLIAVVGYLFILIGLVVGVADLLNKRSKK